MKLSPKQSIPLDIAVYSSIRDAGPDWDKAAPQGDLFLQRAYLEALERCPPKGMTFRYVLLRYHGEPAGVFYAQVQYFQGSESIRYHRDRAPLHCFFQTFSQNLKGLVARRVGFNTLICGNLTLSGNHGYYFGRIDLPEHLLLEQCQRAVRADLEAQGIAVSVTLVKDFEPERGPHEGSMRQMRYHPFRILPSLILDLRPEWRDFSDYLAALSSKYRVRARKAQRLLEASVQARNLTSEEIIAMESRLFALYQRVVDDSGFNVIHLHPGYFQALVRHLPEDFHVRGYFLDGELIGFLTAITNHNGEMEAHFLGYDEAYNPGFKLYLNMLLDLIRLAIDHRSTRLIYARTADEIKSSVGAVPVDLTCYIRHRSPFSNKFIRPLLDYLRPEEQPVLRHPFREVAGQELTSSGH